MPDAIPFLTAIASNPDDDLPRLVYADWLDEHGDPDRAEFTRLQCHTARVGPLDPTWAPGKLREFDLFKANEAKWRPGGGAELSLMLMDRWRRGFPACIDLTDIFDGVYHAGEWCNGSFHISATPDDHEFDWHRHTWPAVGPVRELLLSGWQSGHPSVLHAKQLRTVRSISLIEWFSSVRADVLESFAFDFARLPSDHFPELTTLVLTQGELNQFAIQSLAGAPLLKKVTGLYLRFPTDMRNYGSLDLWREATNDLLNAVAPQLECLSLHSLPPVLIPTFAAVRWPRLRSLTVTHTHEDGLSSYDFSQTPNLIVLAILHDPSGSGRRFDPNPLQAFDDGWPEASLKVLDLGDVPADELRPWLAYPERFSLDFFSADVKGGRLRMDELTSYPLTRGLKGLAGSFTNSDLAPLADARVLPELHTIWSSDKKSPPKLRWHGGTRTAIFRDTMNTGHPARDAWCAWHKSLFGQ